MTREEVISELKYAQAMCEFNPSTGEVGFRNDEDRRQYEAFDMAIEVLKAEPEPIRINLNECEVDLISREDAIEATWFEPSYTDPLNVLTEVRDRLKVLPSAQLQKRVRVIEK